MLPVSVLIFLAVWLVLLPAAYETSGSDMGLFTLPALLGALFFCWIRSQAGIP